MLVDSQDDVVLYDDREELEDAEYVIDNEVETEGKGGDYKYTPTSKTAIFRATKSNEVNNEHLLPCCLCLKVFEFSKPLSRRNDQSHLMQQAELVYLQE